jgi:thymidylate synthase (FAD)
MNVDYLDHMGTDLTVVNAARVSFDTVSTELSKKDIGLINFLARGCTAKDWDNEISELYAEEMDWDEIEKVLKWVKNMPTHWSPFSHAMISMRETVPIFVARQRFKHMVGFTYNETSRRYVDDTPEFHVPDVWRARPEGGIKQGSGDKKITHLRGDGTCFINEHYEEFIAEAKALYEHMIVSGVAPEQARMVLPQSMLTTYWVTGSLYAWANAYIQRSDPHAQVEIQDLAKQWNTIIEPLFPNSWKALTQ